MTAHQNSMHFRFSVKTPTWYIWIFKQIYFSTKPSKYTQRDSNTQFSNLSKIYYLKLSLEQNTPAILERQQWMTLPLMSVNLDTVQRWERERKRSDPNSLRTSTGERRRAEAMQLEIEMRWSAGRELELSNRSIWGPMEPFTAKSLERTLAIQGVERKDVSISRAVVFSMCTASTLKAWKIT